MENNKIVIKQNGKEKVYRVILNVENVNSKNYVLYTDDKEVNGNINCYAAIYTKKDDKYKLSEIKNEKDYKLLSELLDSLQNIGEE